MSLVQDNKATYLWLIDDVMSKMKGEFVAEGIQE